MKVVSHDVRKLKTSTPSLAAPCSVQFKCKLKPHNILRLVRGMSLGCQVQKAQKTSVEVSVLLLEANQPDTYSLA